MKGFPVVISTRGIPVVAVENGAPLASVAENNLGTPIQIVDKNGSPLVIEGLTPVINWDWQETDVTVADSGEWIGYSNGDLAYPPFNPPIGLISNQPTSVTDMIALFQDVGSGDIVVVFNGDYTQELQLLKMAIGGFELNPSGYSLQTGNTWLRFSGLPGDFESGSIYEVVFYF